MAKQEQRGCQTTAKATNRQGGMRTGSRKALGPKTPTNNLLLPSDMAMHGEAIYTSPKAGLTPQVPMFEILAAGERFLGPEWKSSNIRRE